MSHLFQVTVLLLRSIILLLWLTMLWQFLLKLLRCAFSFMAIGKRLFCSLSSVFSVFSLFLPIFFIILPSFSLKSFYGPAKEEDKLWPCQERREKLQDINLLHKASFPRKKSSAPLAKRLSRELFEPRQVIVGRTVGRSPYVSNHYMPRQLWP